MAFTSMLCRFTICYYIACYWKSMYQDLDCGCLEHYDESLLLHEIVHVSSLFFLDWRNWNRAVTRTGVWLAGISTLTQSHVISNDYKRLARFQGKSASQFGYIDALKIKYFWETHFSQMLIFTCFFIDSSNVYKRIKCVS